MFLQNSAISVGGFLDHSGHVLLLLKKPAASRGGGPRAEGDPYHDNNLTAVVASLSMEYQNYSLQLLSGQMPVVVSNRVRTKVYLRSKRTIACVFHSINGL